MTTWYTSDLHFGHANIIGFCDRPWDDVHSMNKGLVTHYNDIVDETDTVYFLGDIAMGQIDKSLQWITRLNGNKLLIPGNHDRCWKGNKKVRDIDIKRYEDVGFTILDGQVETVIGHTPVMLCHFPAVGDSREGDRYEEWRPPKDYPGWIINGHVHEKWRQRGRQINVGVDANGYRPVSQEELADIIALGPRNEERRPYYA